MDISRPLIIRSATLGAALIALATIGLCVVFKPDGDVGEFIQHPATAAWAQVFGSMLAIVATAAVAVWADQGAARRQQAQIEAAKVDELRRHSERVTDWQRLLNNAVLALEDVASSTHRNVHPDSVNPQAIVRILANMAGTMDLYLAQQPPNEHLAGAMVAVRAEFDAPLQGVRDFSAAPGNGTPFIEMGLLTGAAAVEARRAQIKYEVGLH